MFICNPRINAGGAFVDIFRDTHVQSNKNFESPDHFSAEVEQGNSVLSFWL